MEPYSEGLTAGTCLGALCAFQQLHNTREALKYVCFALRQPSYTGISVDCRAQKWDDTTCTYRLPRSCKPLI